MSEDAADDLRPHPVTLIAPVDDHIPNGRAIDEIGEYSSKPHEMVAVPCTERHVGMTEHFFGVLERSTLGPWGLLVQAQKLGRVRRLVMSVGDSGLEGGRHLVLEYPPNCHKVYGETDGNASPNLSKVLSTHVAEDRRV